MSEATTIINPPKLGIFTKLAYATSGIPVMIEQRGISAFLLIFYNQVIGLPAHMVAFVLMISSIFDALCDPAVGQWTDNAESRFGRRHPFIYIAIVPFAVGYFLLWVPPVGWSDFSTAVYLLMTLLFLRTFSTFFELPSSALLPELTRDYDERTTIVSLRTMFSIVGGMVMTLLAYKVFLKENPDGTGGILAHDGYFSYGLTAALVMAVVMLFSSVSTHHRIPYLSKPPKRKVGIKIILRELRETISNRSFVALLAVGMLMSTANGARLALELYFGLYFWELTQNQLSILLIAGLVGIVPGAALATWVSSKIGKRRLVGMALIGGIAGNVGPVLLRLVGVMPENGSGILFSILLVDVTITFCFATMTSIMITSMMNDVVEDVEVKTGRRSEGVLLAADSLFRKMVASIGIFVSGVMLTVIDFPEHAERGGVAPDVIAKLAYGYVPITIFYISAFFLLSFYQIDRKSHERNLEILQKRAEGNKA
ncbi:MAG: MFS transporter [Emcibacter sp.]|nr:MFS transporter [Emcibacter sp.]